MKQLLALTIMTLGFVAAGSAQSQSKITYAQYTPADCTLAELPHPIQCTPYVIVLVSTTDLNVTTFSVTLDYQDASGKHSETHDIKANTSIDQKVGMYFFMEGVPGATITSASMDMR
jgi:hypothetical protein